jgi:hypothetical protein
MDHKDFLINNLEYRNGELYWKSGRRAGKRADLLNKALGYRRVRFAYAPYKDASYWAHRVVWLLHHGDWPEHDIDHINRDRSDNRIENLRQATKQENCTNKAAKSGFKGVRFHEQTGKWQARIASNYREQHIGLFSSDVEAAKAYDEKARELHGQYATLNFP